ncbi:RelA/SpoT family protein [Pseudoxanthomonas wuyuanensis]|uniref:GTP pyrophosphokinase n=1 Tax=Pseudoxanthomonas wuyuanensis TaxID=1073196 RepID=A0A286D7V2_9GAMM|nr:bifunctional (p)ppGpp synthetase/guanosine-3',5'-bis(diphosphate) 3'-pyrophosphohydrolase [Pseudoxanthomonas wuyuanensis]KAF1720346.1 bifunctional (p)ppGpp synthetase/guanosine-3',5'-bis(diphosphate) 3'-pyrophosphohydrolase [Pseudoxanthomonas wuyuanensis]SOD54731.1 GTP pyrophosphokinase [Pseudoxanthomonas wuyuanensis]
MSSAVPDIQALLERASAAALPASARDSMQQALLQLEPGVELSEAQPVVADTLDTLASLGADGEVIAATLLFAVPALQEPLKIPLAGRFPGIAGLLEGQAAAAQVWALHAEQGRGANNEGLRRLLLAIVRDLRVVPILLARQLARMRRADRLPQSERHALAQLTRDIHAPLANRLGIWQLKWELEDLAFRYLEPDIYHQIAAQLDEKRAGRERYIESVKLTLREALAGHGIAADISGRPKHIYSIWRKMQKKQVSFDELYDLRAVRIAVDDVAACYAALGIVHALWLPIPSEFDDYIARPKANDYRSLHTAVVGPEGRTLEVQIRTHEMHAQAELGVAAHWRYKEGGGDKAFDRKIAWMRRLLDQSAEAGQDGDSNLAGDLGAELIEERIYTLTPKGEVIDLPQGGTVLDFAYHVHTMVGHRTRGAKVNGRIVPLTHALRSGDRVEILTSKTGEPKRDWLLPANGYLASGRSRDKVRAWFHRLDRTRNLQAGRELLERELKRLGLHHADLAAVAKKFHAENVDELYIQVALGDVGPNQIGRALHEEQRAQSQPAPVSQPRRTPRRAPAQPGSRFTVQGVGNLLVQLARCCQPVAGEPIAGYLTRGRGVTVHRTDCAAFSRLAAANPQRVLPVEWGQAGGGYEVDVQITAIDRKWLLKDITTLIAQEDANVLDINSDNARDSGKARLRLRLKVADFGQLSTLLRKLDALPGVQEARRSG